MTFSNQNDFISFRHHVYEAEKSSDAISLKELGPRFELKPYSIKLGLADFEQADSEWALRPFKNTAGKHTIL